MSRNFSTYNLVYRHIWSTYGQSWPLRASYMLQVATRACKLIIQPIAVSLIITALSRRDFDAAERAVIVFVVSSLVIGILTPITKYIGMLGENLWYRNITGSFFEKLVIADLDFFNNNLSGSLTSATRQYLDSTIHLVRSIRDRYITTILSIVFPLGVIAWLDPLLGTITIALSLCLAVYLVWASQILNRYRAKARKAYHHNSGLMADIVSNIMAVKSSAQEKARVAQVKKAAAEEGVIFTERYTVQSKLIALREVITVAFFVLLLWLTVQRMSHGHITITTAVLVVTYTTTILTGIYSLSDDLDEHDNLIDKIVPAFDVLDRSNNVQDPTKPKPLENVKGSVEFRDVSFSYEKDDAVRAVFSKLNLTIPAGQKVGIVGLSGAGKSTLAKLLLRFNDVDDGSVLIDGVDVRHVKQIDLRRHIGYVPQEPLLFHSSIRDNVLLSNPDATDDQVKRALSVAHATDFIKQLPDGLDSIVGERGVKLSGGQKQRIAIARAVLQHTPIMILDEATSALDSESEQIIKDSFAQVLKGKTALVIAHRLSTLSHMDRIVVIKQGRISEQGTHNQLLANNADYAKLWQRQLQHKEDPLDMSKILAVNVQLECLD